MRDLECQPFPVHRDRRCDMSGHRQASVAQRPSGVWSKPLVAWGMGLGRSAWPTEDANKGEKKSGLMGGRGAEQTAQWE